MELLNFYIFIQKRKLKEKPTYNMTTFPPIKHVLSLILLPISFACSQKPLEIPLAEREIQAENAIDYLALGDSYTIGEGVSPEERWPEQLAVELGRKGKKVENLQIIAKTGWTTRNLLEGIEDAELSSLKENKLVSLLIGVNNQYQNLAFPLFEKEFDLLIEEAIRQAGDIQHVFVVSIPDYGVTPFGSGNSEQIGKELDTYNSHMEGICDSLDIPFINITDLSRELGDSDGALAADKLHPSGKQYGKWVEKILPVVVGMLRD